MSLDSLLNLMIDNQFHSGEALGLRLGISRAAVWKRIKKLESLGVEINSVQGKGYRLPKSLELFSANEILKELSAEAKSQLTALKIFLSVDSTNSHAMNCVGETRFVCLAEQQTSGRGRRGKHWASPFGQNIYLSLCWHFQGGSAQLEGLSLAVAVAVIRALEDFGIMGVNVKWPNDLLYKNRKLAGILLEMSGEADGVCKVVIGVGVNVNMQSERIDIDQPWIDIFSITQKMLSRNKLTSGIVSHLFSMLEQFEKYGFSIFKSEWLSKDVYFGKRIKLLTSSIVVEGIERGVDDGGALCLEVDNEMKKFYGGEISVRPV